MSSNGSTVPSQQPSLNRADEVQDLLSSVQSLILPFIKAADEDAAQKSTGHGLQVSGQGPRTALVEHHPPKKLQSLISGDLEYPQEGKGRDGLLEVVKRVLQYSVNTWDQGFMDKLYASTNAVGLVSELVLATLNTNVHVYQVSPVLTLVEKQTSRALAAQFGLPGPHAGGISQPGGSAANQSSIVIARNTLFPDTKTEGIAGGGRKFVLFTSAHGHYSLEKAAQMFGFGSANVRSVPVDAAGRMIAAELEALVVAAKEKGETPFYVNATAGTTVLGSYDPFDAIADVCAKYGLWMHVDGSWGGPVVFSGANGWRLKGVQRADSIGVTPHKMLGVPMTCSFLLGRDMRRFQRAMTLPAGYLFHNADEDDEGEGGGGGGGKGEDMDGSVADTANPDPKLHPGIEQDDDREIWDLADLTPQCGRRGDSLKLALSWIYHGSDGFEALIDRGFDAAAHLATLIQNDSDFSLVSENPPPCWQVCFYYRKETGTGHRNRNSRMTEKVAGRLIPRGFMIDYAPGEEGKFFRVVVNGGTLGGTLDGLVKAIKEVGREVVV